MFIYMWAAHRGVSFPRAKPIDDLYNDVAGYDLVVVPDAPLSSALIDHVSAHSRSHLVASLRGDAKKQRTDSRS